METMPKAGEIWRHKGEYRATATIYEVDAGQVFYRIDGFGNYYPKAANRPIEVFTNNYEPIPTTVTVTVTLPIESAEAIQSIWGKLHFGSTPYNRGLCLIAQALRDAEVK